MSVSVWRTLRWCDILLSTFRDQIQDNTLLLGHKMANTIHLSAPLMERERERGLRRWWGIKFPIAKLHPSPPAGELRNERLQSVRAMWHLGRTYCVLFHRPNVISTRAVMKHLTFKFSFLKCRVSIIPYDSKKKKKKEKKYMIKH